jgi:hypothetical protein
VADAAWLLILAGGRGSWLACDLARSGGKIGRLGRNRQTVQSGFAAASQQIV